MSEPSWLDTMRVTLPNRSEIELLLLAVNNPAVHRFSGLTVHEHRMLALQKLFPSRRENPWRSDMIGGYQFCRDESRKEYMILGASNSTKTSNLADLAVELWFEAPVVTSVFIASPYETATETGIWARIQEQFYEAKDNCPALPGRVVQSENAIIYNSQNPLSFIRVTTVDQIGKLVGKKSKLFDVGIIVIIIDELPALPRPEVLTGGAGTTGVLSNLRSVPNFILIGAGNFADPTDALGQLAEPVKGYENLDLHRDYEWLSTRGGLVKRYDGDRSPNVIGGMDVYPFLPTLAYRDDLRSLPGGEQSPDYFRFWHSFPLLSQVEFTITNTAKIRNGNARDTARYTSGEILKGSACDPGFGGDPCIQIFWKLGWEIVEETDEEGSEVQTLYQVFEMSEAPLIVPVSVSSESRDVEDQIADYCKEQCEQRDIPPENFGFDDSMRSGIVTAFYRRWSIRVTAISLSGVASTRRISAIRRTKDAANRGNPQKNTKTARDVYFNFNTELHFAVGDTIQGGQFRGLSRSPAAERQLTRRHWKWQGNAKKKIEDKDEFKKSNQGKSPNEADAIVIGVELARRRGFVLNSMASAAGGALKMILDYQNERSFLRKLKTQDSESNRLPSGKLHATNHSSGKGRLKRLTASHAD